MRWLSRLQARAGLTYAKLYASTPLVTSTSDCNVLRVAPRLAVGRSFARLYAQMHPFGQSTLKDTPRLPADRHPAKGAGFKVHSDKPGATELPKPEQKSFFCRMCGKPLELQVPASEHEWRHVCIACGYIDYFNPKLVVGCIVEHAGKVLLCRRAIEPCINRWTLPAGFLEMGEAAMHGAARETLEEANAHVTSLVPFSLLDIPVIGQGYLLFRAKLADPFTFSPGAESLETELFDPETDLPYDEIAFSSIRVALELFREDVRANRSCMHYGVINKRPGSHPADPTAFFLSDHVTA